MTSSVKGQSNLHVAKAVKKDEFYTQLSDVENEMRHYKDHFKGKIVYCNCDDPRESAFFKYFSLNFEHLGLKRLIASCYKSQSLDLFSNHDSDKAIWIVYDGDKDGDRLPSVDEMTIYEFEGDGDFRSAESIALLEMADIVVTNPPFSLFREYIAQLMEYEKDFIIIGSMSAICYKEVWPFFLHGKIWLGCNNGTKYYIVPDDYDKNIKIGEDGKRYTKLGNTYWYTNLNHPKRSIDLPIYKKYEGNEDDYPMFDNILAINVDKLKDIPCDYEGVMGVPITFIEHHNPSQFELVGCSRDVMWGRIPELANPNWDGVLNTCFVNGKMKFTRILIKRRV